MRKPRLGAASISVAAGALALVACGPSVDAEPIEYYADYPFYEELADLFSNADLVIDARLTEDVEVREDPLTLPPDDPNDPRSNPELGVEEADRVENDEDPFVITVYKAEVREVFKGDAREGEIIEVMQLGGEFDGVMYVEPEATSLRKDSQYILFLRAFPGFPASLLNPQQAQYAVTAEGKIEALTENPIEISLTELDQLSTQ